MKRRIIRTFTAILLMIVAIAGFMPYASKQVKAEPATKQIIFDEDTVKSINTDLTYSFSKEGITLSPDCDNSYQFEEGGGAFAGLTGKELIVRHGSFTFSSSIGKILKIEIETYNADRLPDGWNWNREDRIVSWEGEPSYAVTIINEAERMGDETYIGAITKMTFTIITEDVTDIALSDSSLEMKPEDTKSLTATVSPETATEKEVRWSSSNTDVATVDDDGLVTAIAEGEAIITATATNGTEDTSDDKTATCMVTVKNPDPDPDPTPTPTPDPTPAPTPDPVTPFPIPKTGIEASGYDVSFRYIVLFGICVIASAILSKKR